MSKYTIGQIKNILTLADNYAKQNSTCKKTAVGCYLIKEDAWRTVISKGANCNYDESCKETGCLREEVFGDNSKAHRSVCRCANNHSEIDALRKADKAALHGATAFVTRYPCEDCTRQLVGAGIKTIYYGRPFEMSEKSMNICKENGVEVHHIKDWNCDENDLNN